MTYTTANFGAEYGSDVQTDGIIAYIDGGDYTQDQLEAMTEALFSALQAEVDDLLPDGWSWHPGASEFVHPVDAESIDEEDLADVFSTAWQAVTDRFAEIEAETLPVLPVLATVDELPADPIERAQGATRLIDQSRGALEMFAQVRNEAIHAATRSSSYSDVAAALGVSEAAINKAVTEHGRHSRLVER